ncbi:hypothetical protein RFI_28178 [Reticulomyxa filosa]|uniref:K Homology domain-containing protein n=1 Tax=Reticulomyxa filosa TaxID=46433 RepID=X6M5K6_RETFI|nr:hypothetical protein RFI_28178 [Reticulomyxa filosa]|eukprot:ETO09209.1 hypothetical protein RFI_28178 [Reticulomyxa filosa]
MKMITIQGSIAQMTAARDEIVRCVQEMSRYRQKEVERQHDKKRSYNGPSFVPASSSSSSSSSSYSTSSSSFGHINDMDNVNSFPYFHSSAQSPSSLSMYERQQQQQQQKFEPPPIPNPTRFNSGGLPGGQMGLMQGPVQPSLPQYEEALQPPIRSGTTESGYIEVEIPSDIVGLVIGKSASNVKAMKDRTRCDIRVQKDEDAAPDSKVRLVALRGSIDSVKAARNELAKVIHVSAILTLNFFFFCKTHYTHTNIKYIHIFYICIHVYVYTFIVYQLYAKPR